MAGDAKPNGLWFVRTDGRVRGPYPLDVLLSMRNRGRLDSLAEVSHDRVAWMFATTIPGLFGSGSAISRDESLVIDGEVVEGGADARHAAVQSSGNMLTARDAQWFVMVDGREDGPVSLAALQDRVARGGVRPSDLVWSQGASAWGRAGDVPALSFPRQRDQRLRFFFDNMGLCVSGVICCVLLIVVPICYVRGTLVQQRKDSRAAAEKIREEQQQLERDKAEEIARLERESKEAADRLKEERMASESREERMMNHRLQVAGSLETVKLQYTTLITSNLRADEQRRRMDELEQQLTAIDDAIEKNKREMERRRLEEQDAARKRGEEVSKQLREQRELLERNQQELEKLRKRQ